MRVILYFLFIFALPYSFINAQGAAEVITNKKRDITIGIISAVPGESGRLLELMEQPVVSNTKGLRTYHKGRLFGIDTVLVSSRIGKVAASATAVNLILEYNVDLVVFTGVAGALDSTLNVGDVVYEYDIPYIVVRVISDYASNEKVHVNIKKFVQQASGYYATAIMKNIYKLITIQRQGEQSCSKY